MTNEEAIEIIDKGLDIGNQMPFLTVDQMNEAKQKALEQFVIPFAVLLDLFIV